MYNIGYTELGYTDIGAEADVGAVKRAPIGIRRLPTGKVLPTTPYGNTVRPQSIQPNRYAYKTFGLGSSTLGGGGTTSLSQVFQEVFRPERLLLQDSVANNSTVNSIFIGVKPQVANTAAMPASAFYNNTFETRVEFDTGNPGQSFTVNLTLAAAGTISGMAFGSVVS